MKLLKLTFVFGTVAALSATPAVAQTGNSDPLCTIYSKMGEVLVETMLPRTMQEFVDATTGKNPAIMNEFTDSILTRLTAEEMAVLAANEADAGLIGEASGQVAIQILMNGQASSARQVGMIMNEACVSVGSNTIIENQRRANAAVNQNMGN